MTTTQPPLKHTPYWWEAAPPDETADAMPARADVVIVGSGFTGLTAALALARGGRDVVVLEAGAAASGCSSRNGGQVSPSLKPDLASLVARYGPEHGRAILEEGREALAFIRAFVAEEGIDCDWSDCGRLIGAHNPAQYERLARGLGTRPTDILGEAHPVPRAQIRSEIGTDGYHGGIVIPSHASLHPGKLAAALVAKARAAGARVVTRTPALGIDGRAGDLTVATPTGAIKAREAIVATNGYTGAATPDLRRRVIPIASSIIATRPLTEVTARRLIPRARVISDTRKVVFYYRLSPDHRRLLFGGRVGSGEAPAAVVAGRLKAAMIALFPELVDTPLSHVWQGTVAYTFDHLPHLGARDGVRYAMGYCGSGVSLSVYFGTRVGQRALGLPEGRTALDTLEFPRRFWHTGHPWFLPAALAWYRIRDRLPL